MTEEAFDAGKIKLYSDSLKELGATESALVLHAQGLTNAQIQQVLALKQNNDTKKALSVTEQYMAMQEAGLLVSKKQLTAAQVQDNIQSAIGTRADAKELMASMGLKVAKDAEGKETVQLTTKKLAQAVASGKLSAAEAVEIGLSTGVIASNTAEAISLDVLIAKLHMKAIAIWQVVKAQLALMAASPWTWVAVGVAALGGLVLAYDALTVSAEEAREKFKETDSALSELNGKLEQNEQQIKQLEAIDPNDLSITDKEDLEELRAQNEELRIRQQYLEEQRQMDADAVAKHTNNEYYQEFGKEDVSKDTIDAYKEQFKADKEAPKPKASSYLEGADNTESSSYAAAQQANKEESETLASLIAEYEYLKEAKQEAVEANDGKALEEYDQKLQDVKGSLIEAREKLQGMKMDFKNSGGYDTQVTGIDQRVSTIDNTLYGPGKQVVDYVKNNTTKEQKDQLLQLQQTGELTEEVLRKNFADIAKFLDGSTASFDDFIDALGVYKKEIEEVADSQKLLTKSDMISQIDAASKGFESLDKVLQSMSGEEPFDFSTLADPTFVDTFGGMGEAYEEFVDKVTNSPKDIEGCQTALNTLVDTWIDTKGIISGVTDETADLTIAMLEQYGIANASEVVMTELARSHAQAAWDAGALTNATYEEIVGLAAESEATDQGRRMFEIYAVQKQFANFSISENGSIEALNSVVSALGLATNAWIQYYRAKAQLEAMANATVAKTTKGAEAKGWKSYAMKDASGNDVEYIMTDSSFAKEQTKQENIILNSSKQVAEDWEKMANDITVAKPTGGGTPGKGSSPGGNGKGSGGGGGGSSAEKEIDWLERKLQLLEERRQDLESKTSSDLLSYLGLDPETITQALALLDKTNNGIDLTAEETQWLAQTAKESGYSVQEFFAALQNGGTESRASAFSQLIEQDRINMQEYANAAASYKAQYEEAAKALSPELREKIESGGDGVEIFSGEQGESIQEIIDLYDKWHENEGKADDAKKELFADTQAMFDNEVESLEQRATLLENQAGLIEKQIDYIEATGNIVNASSYESLIYNLQQQSQLVSKQLELRKKELEELKKEDPSYQDNPWYYEVQQEIQNLESAMVDLRVSQADYREELRQLPIENMQKLVDMYDSITSTIKDWGDMHESAGGILGEDYYQTLIDNGHQSINQLQKQADAVREVMDEYEVGSDKYVEMLGKLNDIQSAITGIVSNQNEWNQAILEMPINRISALVENLQLVRDGLQAVADEQNGVVDAISEMVDRQRELYEEQQEAEEKVVQDKIDNLNEELEILGKQNEERDLQIQKEQALYDLHNAQTQKKIQAIVDGELTYIEDENAIREAQQAVQDADYEIAKHGIETQIESLEDDLESISKKYEELYEKLDKISDKWGSVPEDTEYDKNKQLVEQWLGKGWEDKILSGNDEDIYKYFKDQFEQNAESLGKYEDQIETAENIQKLINTYITAYRNGTITQEQAMAGVQSVLSNITNELTAGENIKHILNYLSSANQSGATTNEILNATQAQLQNAANQMIESMKVYEQNSSHIAENMQSFGELTDNISDMRNIMDDVEDNLDDNFSSLEDVLEDGFDNVVNALDGYRDRIEEEEEEDDNSGSGTNGNGGWQSDIGGGKPGYIVGGGSKPSDYGPGTNNGSDPGRSRSISPRNMMAAPSPVAAPVALMDEPADEETIVVGDVVYTKVGIPGILKSLGVSPNTDMTKFYSSIETPRTDWNRPVITLQQTAPRQADRSVNITMGDINVHEVQNPDQFAKAMKLQLPGIARQEMGKR